MKILILVIPLVLISSCEETGGPHVYNSIEGKWKYTTPTQDMSVEFEISKLDDEYKIKKGVIYVETKNFSIDLDISDVDVDGQTGVIHFIYLYAEGHIGVTILFQSVLRNEFYTTLTAGQVDYSPNLAEDHHLEFQTITR